MHCMVIGQIHASHNGEESYLKEYPYFYATAFKKKSCNVSHYLEYCKVASASLSHAGFFRLSMKGNLMFIYCDLLGKS